MESSKPVVLFVHGSWHNPEHFLPVREVFERAGYETSCPRAASAGKRSPIGLQKDAMVIRDELKRLIGGESKNVIVVAHSYGGVVSAEAVDAEFSTRSRAEKGLQGGVVGMLYLCAFVLPVGESIKSTFNNQLPPFIKTDEKTQLCEISNAEHVFYNDLAPTEQKKWTDRLLPVPAETQSDAITQATYLYHPTTYLYCTNDQALPYEIQQMMVDNANRAGAKIETAACEAGHSPYLSMPEKVLEVVKNLRTYQS